MAVSLGLRRSFVPAITRGFSAHRTDTFNKVDGRWPQSRSYRLRWSLDGGVLGLSRVRPSLRSKGGMAKRSAAMPAPSAWACHPPAFMTLHEPEFDQSVPESITAQVEQLGGLRLVVISSGEGLSYKRALELA